MCTNKKRIKQFNKVITITHHERERGDRDNNCIIIIIAEEACFTLALLLFTRSALLPMVIIGVTLNLSENEKYYFSKKEGNCG